MCRIFYEKRKLAMPGLLASLTGICIWGVSLCYPAVTAENVVINEVCSNNFSAAGNENGIYADYVELYNPGMIDVELDGFFLSDDKNEPQKLSLDKVTIPAGGYAVIWLDGGETEEENTSFRISSQGDTVCFSGGEEKGILDAVSVPALSYNISYARNEDGSSQWRQMTATPGASNEEGEAVKIVGLEKPEFDAESGFYEDPFKLELKTAAQEAVDEAVDQVIYYTLDGSEPDNTAMVYENAISIGDASSQKNVYAARTDLAPTSDYTPDFLVDKATVVRAVSYDPQRDVYSDVVTKVYFVGFGQRTEYENLAVVSITADPEDLFDAETGIYGNGMALEAYKEAGGMANGELLSSFTDESGSTHYLYMASNAFQEGKEWEREAVVTYFDEKHNFCFSQDVGIRISGQSSRSASQKSLNLFSRDIYDDNTVFPYTFFEGTSYSTIKLRNGGSDRNESKIKDPMDLVFLFWSISVGIICGAGFAMIAVIMSVVLTVGILIADWLPIAKAPQILLINSNTFQNEKEILQVVSSYCSLYHVKARNLTESHLDMAIEVRVKQEGELTAELMRQEGVTSASLVSHDGEVTF